MLALLIPVLLLSAAPTLPTPRRDWAPLQRIDEDRSLLDLYLQAYGEAEFAFLSLPAAEVGSLERLRKRLALRLERARATIVAIHGEASVAQGETDMLEGSAGVWFTDAGKAAAAARTRYQSILRKLEHRIAVRARR